MNRQRELILQRVSRIGGIAALENTSQSTRFRGKPVGTLSIEAAIGTYIYHKQDTYMRISNEPKQQEKEQLSHQMSEYMAAIEETRLVNTGTYWENDNQEEEFNSEKLEKVLEKDPSARYQLRRYSSRSRRTTVSAYDKLDANRSAGFLLYSYNKNGVHSVLGEGVAAGSYGGYIVEGDFQSKA